MAAVLSGELSYRKAGKKFNVKSSTLKWRMDKAKNGEKFIRYASRRVFSIAQEAELMDYFTFAAGIHHGITPQKARTLAYEYAVLYNSTNIPENWTSNQIAGEDWLRSFTKRHGQLILRNYENTPKASDVAAYSNNVRMFYDNLAAVYSEHDFHANEIFHLGETDLYKVLDPPKFIQRRKGELVTLVGIISASGTRLPPVYVFPPRTKHKNHFLSAASKQSLRLSTKNGGMTSELLIEVLKHLKNFAQCTKERPILLILDSHQSHTSIAGIKFCRENGIELLSLPPHCSHKLQPMAKCVTGPFKAEMRVAIKDFKRLETNAGKKHTIFDFLTLSKQAIPTGFSPKNIKSSFKSAGIFPFDRDAYSADDFWATSSSSGNMSG